MESVTEVVDAIGKGNKSMSVIAGSCGYIAPGESCYCLTFDSSVNAFLQYVLYHFSFAQLIRGLNVH